MPAREALAPVGARKVRCPLCWARPLEPCQLYYPRGDHLARWLAACAAGRITRGQLAAAVGCLTVVIKRAIVPEPARSR